MKYFGFFVIVSIIIKDSWSLSPNNPKSPVDDKPPLKNSVSDVYEDYKSADRQTTNFDTTPFEPELDENSFGPFANDQELVLTKEDNDINTDTVSKSENTEEIKLEHLSPVNNEYSEITIEENKGELSSNDESESLTADENALLKNITMIVKEVTGNVSIYLETYKKLNESFNGKQANDTKTSDNSSSENVIIVNAISGIVEDQITRPILAEEQEHSKRRESDSQDNTTQETYSDTTTDTAIDTSIDTATDSTRKNAEPVYSYDEELYISPVCESNCVTENVPAIDVIDCQ